MNIINNIFNNNNNIIFEKKNQYKIIKTDINDIINNYELYNWNKNRPLDEIRVNDIKNYYIDNNIDIIPGIIYLWYNNDKYYILDGLHRYNAALNINKNLNIIIHINYIIDEEHIINEFININKSISIPSVYIDNNQLKKQICENVVKHLITKYPKFVSPSKKHYIYNFNRDILIEYFSNFNLDFSILNLDNKIFNILLKLNKEAKNNVINGNIVHPKKCEIYNFYLFYLDKYYIKQEIEKIIKNNHQLD